MIIDLKNRRKHIVEYNASLVEAVEKLEAMSFELYSMAVNLAMKGPWREWDESVPDGSALRVASPVSKTAAGHVVSGVVDVNYHELVKRACHFHFFAPRCC